MVDVAHEIAHVSGYFEKINFPAQPLDKEAQEYFTKFFAIDGFIRLCDRMFGKYYFKHGSERHECWMDIANRNPKGNVAAELFKLLSPGSQFFLALEAFSAPDSSFSSNLKYEWKTDAEDLDDTYAAHTIDFPLSALLQSTKVLYESENADLYRLPRSSCPAFLFIPFWMPPVVTRTERSQGRILTSLRCKPLSYFFIRFIFYLFMATDAVGALLFTTNDSERNGLINYLKKIVQPEKKLLSFPFYNNLATAYIQYFVTPSIVRHIGSKKRLEDVSWSTGDICAGMLLCLSHFLSTRSFSDIDQEYRRGRQTDQTKLANIFGSLPLLSELHITISRDSEQVQEFVSAAPPDFSVDSISRSCNDIYFVKRSLYRNCLIAIRETLLSLDDISKYRCLSITNIINLWKALVNPAWRDKLVPSQQYIIDHIEAYIFIVVDVLGCLAKSNFFHVINVSGATVLRETLEVLNCDVAVSTLNRLRNNYQFSSRLAENYVLNWKREDGSTQLPNIFSRECIPAVSRARRAIRSKMEIKGCSQPLKSELQKCLNEMSKLFPIDVDDGSHIDITKELLFHTPSTGSQPDSPAIEKNKNKKYNSRLLENQRKSSFHWVPSPTCREEIPFLVGLSRLLDCVVINVQEVLYFSSIKRCINGHKMWLTELRGERCTLHGCNTAIWSCALCQTNYCADCKGFPMQRGEVLDLNHTSCFSCSRCNKFISDRCVSFKKSSTNCVYCSSCASRPFNPYSSRWIASYRTFTVFIFLVVIYIFFFL